MSKPQTERALAENEAKAVTTNIRISPQKLNLVATLIRGKKVSTALADLTFSRKRIASTVKKTLESAVANAENNHQLDVDALVVKEAFVGRSLIMKRWNSRGRGRMARIMKRFSHLTIVVREAEESACWGRRSTRRACGSASTAPGTRAGSRAGRSTAGCRTRTSRSANG
jgi:large subunit ribosomal protein L22